MLKKIILFLTLFLTTNVVITSAIIKEETRPVIYIDPGHGGIDGGCQGKDGTKEKELNLEISFILRELLENLGFVTKMTRSGYYKQS